MRINGEATQIHELSGRVWRFGDCEFDELAHQLRVRSVVVDLESKPLEVLLQLLIHAGEVVTREELLDAVWPDLSVVEGSLTTAISKLRKALGDDPSMILTVPKVGYRLGVSVHCTVHPVSSAAHLGLAPGDPVPGRDPWRLVRKLDPGGTSEVWLAEHVKTREPRVFKFAVDGVQLKGLKREATTYRILRESLGDRPDFIRILEWNFETSPYFLESEYGGSNLADWAEAQGGLPAIPIDRRLRLVAGIAQAIAAAHSVGVLHKDVKPMNVLVSLRPGEPEQVRVADFGAAALLDPSRLAALGITNVGFTQTGVPDSERLSGTLLYLAPEILAGHSPTVASDVYSLGVLLFQIVAGDFRTPLAPGWEASIADPVLRDDIASAASGDPARRLSSAAEFAERLLTLDRRRLERDELARIAERARLAEQKLAASRARRPWILLAAAALSLGVLASFALFLRASRERDAARRQTAIAAAINRFLADDLLARSNPFQSGTASETFVDAVKQASSGIDAQFRAEPLIAARLHQTIARALDSRTDYAGARREYERAAAFFDQAGGPVSEEAVTARLQLAAMEARTYQKDGLPRARTIMAEEEPKIARLQNASPELPVWIHTARGMVALIANDARGAATNFQIAYTRASALPGFDRTTLLALQQRLAFSYIRLGDGAAAEALFRKLIDAYTRMGPVDHPALLRVRLNLAQAFMIQSKHAEAIRETTAIYPLFVNKLGEDHELTMQVLATRTQSEGSLGYWEDSIRDGLAIYKLAVRKQGPLSFYAIATLSDAALAQCRSGNTASGTPNARKAYDSSRQAFGERAGLTGGAAFTLASCLIPTGNLGEAARLLETIDQPTVAQLAGVPDWGANVSLALAEIAVRRGDRPAAKKLLAIAKPAFSSPQAEPYQKKTLNRLTAEVGP